MSGSWSPNQGDSIVWKVTASNRVTKGRLFWSNTLGIYQANFRPAIPNCKEADASSDKDSDNYSYCNDFALDYFDCNDYSTSINPSIQEDCNSIDDNCNGLVDDIKVFPPILPANGVCIGYNQTCVSGTWTSNRNAIPTYEATETSW